MVGHRSDSGHRQIYAEPRGHNRHVGDAHSDRGEVTTDEDANARKNGQTIPGRGPPRRPSHCGMPARMEAHPGPSSRAWQAGKQVGEPRAPRNASTGRGTCGRGAASPGCTGRSHRPRGPVELHAGRFPVQAARRDQSLCLGLEILDQLLVDHFVHRLGSTSGQCAIRRSCSRTRSARWPGSLAQRMLRKLSSSTTGRRPRVAADVNEVVRGNRIESRPRYK